MDDQKPRELPFTLPSLKLAVLVVPIPMSKEDYVFLMDVLAGAEKAMVEGGQ